MLKIIGDFFLKLQEGMIKSILFLSYFVTLGPTSFFYRITNHPKLPQSFKNKQSTWVNVHSQKPEPDDYLNQY